MSDLRALADRLDAGREFISDPAEMDKYLAWIEQCREAADEIASLRAGAAESNRLADQNFRRAMKAEAQLASARKAAIEECCAALEARADLLTNSLHCGDNASTIATAHRESRALYQAAAIINELALTDEQGKS